MDAPNVFYTRGRGCTVHGANTVLIKKAMSECARFRCRQRWCRTKGRGSRNFPNPTSFGSRHRCPQRNFAQLFLTVYFDQLQLVKRQVSPPQWMLDLHKKEKIRETTVQGSGSKRSITPVRSLTWPGVR